MKIAVEGCCHGELDKIYETIQYIEKKKNIKVDILLICGDFQAVRNRSDLHCMAVPPKYQKMNTFYKYYSGEKTAPVLTVFIGGNHEASNYLQELPYGGWVAPNIYYMGYANILNFGGVRIAGLSGIFKAKDYRRGHFERPPYNDDTKRSAYHVRNLEVFRFKQVSKPIDIFLSHDWPRGIYNYGNVQQLLRNKSYFQTEIEENRLGSPAAEELLYKIQPDYWFSAHLHVKFAAVVQHQVGDGKEKLTKFLSLDKCLPKRKFLQILDIPHDKDKPLKLQLDAEWLAILKSTNHLLSLSRANNYMPGPGIKDRWDFTVKVEEENQILDDFGGDLSLPENFEETVSPYDAAHTGGKAPIPTTMVNQQTTLLCTMLELTDPNAVFLGKESSLDVSTEGGADADVELDDDDDDDEDIDDDDTEYESEPSFVSFSGSERSFSLLSSSTLDESILSVGNQSLLSAGETTPGNPDEIALLDDNEEENGVENDDDDAELKDIMKAQREHQLLDSDDKSTSPKSSLSQSDIEEIDPELSEILAAQKKSQSQSSLSQSDIEEIDAELPEIMEAQKKCQSQSSRLIELSSSKLDEEEVQGLISTEQKFCGESSVGLPVLRPLTQSSPASSEDRSDSEVTHKTHSLALTAGKRTDGSESEDSPQSKKFKRRNQKLYTESAEEDNL